MSAIEPHPCTCFTDDPPCPDCQRCPACAPPEHDDGPECESCGEVECVCCLDCGSPECVCPEPKRDVTP